MNKRYAVIDTTALISYFDFVFNRPSQISLDAKRIIQEALKTNSNIVLSIPSIVFVEIFDKWGDNDEFRAMFVSEVLELIAQCPNIEIKPIDEEVLQLFISLDSSDINLENHDKLILASAMMLQWPLITSDNKIAKYVRKHKILPQIIT